MASGQKVMILRLTRILRDPYFDMAAAQFCSFNNSKGASNSSTAPTTAQSMIVIPSRPAALTFGSLFAGD